MSAALLPLGLAFLMFVVGLRLTFDGLAEVFRRPAALATGLAAQMVALPLLALGIAAALSLSPAMTTGLLVIAAAPGGITSNYVALAARADVALSTAMTLATSLAAGFSIPAVLFLSGELPGEAAAMPALARMGVAMFAVAAIPLLAGIGVRRLFPALSGRAERPLGRLAALVFAAIVLATFWENRAAMAEHAATIGPAAVLLNLCAIAGGFGLGAVTGQPPRRSLAIAVETGLQNVAMAMFVATALLGRSELTAPALVYAVAMNVSALGLIALSAWRRKNADAAAA